MAIDATGTPTANYAIPKINPAADAPSGNGTNAAMDAIDAALLTVQQGATAKPAGIAAGEVPVWNGAAWVRSSATNVAPTSLGSGAPDATKFLRGDGTWAAAGQKTTTSTLAGGPPVAPSDGDIWIATAVDANGTRWQFQYNAGSASAYKWEFIGGPVLVSAVDTPEGQASTGAYAALATAGPSITVARGGDYVVTVASEANASGGDNLVHSFDVGATPALDVDGVELTIASTGWFAFGSRTRLKTGLAAGTALVSKYKGTNTVTTQWRSRTMTVTPIRVA